MLYETLAGLSIFAGGILFSSNRLGSHFFDKRNLIWLFSIFTIFLVSLFFISRNPAAIGELKIMEALITASVLLSTYAFGIFLGFREWLVKHFFMRTVLVSIIFGAYISIIMKWLVLLFAFVLLFILVIYRIILSKHKKDDVLSYSAYALLNLTSVSIAVLYITLIGFEFFESTDMLGLYNAFLFGFLLFEIIVGISILSFFFYLFFPVSPNFYETSSKFLKEIGNVFVMEKDYKKLFVLPILFSMLLLFNHFFLFMTPINAIVSLLVLNEIVSKIGF
jgi:hypothetical protein